MPLLALVPIVQQDNIARPNAFDHTVRDWVRIACKRVSRMDRPCRYLEIASVRGARHRWTLQSNRRSIQRLVVGAGHGFYQLRAAVYLDAVARGRVEVLEIRMLPGVVAQLMAFSVHSLAQRPM